MPDVPGDDDDEEEEEDEDGDDGKEIPDELKQEAEKRAAESSKESGFINQVELSKLPKKSPRAYSFQRPFLGSLFLEGLIFGGAYLWRKICVPKSIRLAPWLQGNLPFLLCFTLFLRAISKYEPPGRLRFGVANLWRAFCVTSLTGYIWRGVCTWKLLCKTERCLLLRLNRNCVVGVDYKDVPSFLKIIE